MPRFALAVEVNLMSFRMFARLTENRLRGRDWLLIEFQIHLEQIVVLGLVECLYLVALLEWLWLFQSVALLQQVGLLALEEELLIDVPVQLLFAYQEVQLCL